MTVVFTASGNKKLSHKGFLLFSEQPRTILTRNFTHLLRVYTRIAVPKASYCFCQQTPINFFLVATSSFLTFACSRIVCSIARRAYHLMWNKLLDCV